MLDFGLIRAVSNNLRLMILYYLSNKQCCSIKELSAYLRLPEKKYNFLYYHVKKMLDFGLIYKNNEGLICLTKKGKNLINVLIDLNRWSNDYKEEDKYIINLDGSLNKISIPYIISYLKGNFNLEHENIFKISQIIYEKISSSNKNLYTNSDILKLLLTTFIKDNSSKDYQYLLDSVFITFPFEKILYSNNKNYDICILNREYYNEYFVNKFLDYNQIIYFKMNYFNIIDKYNLLSDVIDFSLRICINNLNFDNILYDESYINKLIKLINKSILGCNIELYFNDNNVNKVSSVDLKLLYPYIIYILSMLNERKLMISLRSYNDLKCISSLTDENLLKYILYSNMIKNLPSWNFFVSREISSLVNFVNNTNNSLLELFPSISFSNESSISLTSYGFIGDESSTTFNINSLVSLNLPKILLDSKSNENLFYDTLEDLSVSLFKYFDKRYKFLTDTSYNTQVTNETCLNFRININGLFEYVYILTGETLQENKNTQKEYIKLLNFLNNVTNEFLQNRDYDVKISILNDGVSPIKFRETSIVNKLNKLPIRYRRYLMHNGISCSIIPSCFNYSSIYEKIIRETPIVSLIKGGYNYELWLDLNKLKINKLQELFESTLLKYKMKNIELNYFITLCMRCKNKYLGFYESCPSCGSHNLFYVAKNYTKIVKLAYEGAKQLLENNYLYII
jgi:hypothetical protein